MLTLFIFWLLMSGVYQPLTIGFGILSSAFCVWIVNKLEILKAPGIGQDLSLSRLVRYLVWLTAEIAKADWAVAKVIIAPVLPKQQRLILVPATQKTDSGKMLFANSITITPGTVTVETGVDDFIIHALTDEAADKAVLAQMGNYVSSVER